MATDYKQPCLLIFADATPDLRVMGPMPLSEAQQQMQIEFAELKDAYCADLPSIEDELSYISGDDAKLYTNGASDYAWHIVRLAEDPICANVVAYAKAHGCIS